MFFLGFLRTRHLFHLVNYSPWPFFVSIASFSLASSAILYFQMYLRGGFFLFLSFLILLVFMSFWFKDVILEGTYEGHHTLYVQKGLRFGMLLFIVSEIMFFFAFFWGFFHSSLAPVVSAGFVWPPKGIATLDPISVALFNTMVLLLSGASVTWAHHSLQLGYRNDTILGLALTIGLGVLFTLSQVFEYQSSTFQVNDGIYGSVFFLATGFHGFHVIVGTFFLIVCLYRQINYEFLVKQHFGFEAAAWYWHFVDVVWLFLYVVIYCWAQ